MINNTVIAFHDCNEIWHSYRSVSVITVTVILPSDDQSILGKIYTKNRKIRLNLRRKVYDYTVWLLYYTWLQGFSKCLNIFQNWSTAKITISCSINTALTLCRVSFWSAWVTFDPPFASHIHSILFPIFVSSLQYSIILSTNYARSQ